MPATPAGVPQVASPSPESAPIQIPAPLLSGMPDWFRRRFAGFGERKLDPEDLVAEDYEDNDDDEDEEEGDNWWNQASE